MEKTALNLAIEMVQRDERGMLHAYDKQIVTAILTQLLPTEQQQIEAAFAAGHIDGMTDPENLSCYQPSDYFTTKYK